MNICSLTDSFTAIDELKCIKGNGASLISLYVPPQYIAKRLINDLLTNELILSNNIKNDSQRKSVQNALVKAQEMLKPLNVSDFKPNGMAIFIGEDMKNGTDNNGMIIKTVKPKIIKIQQAICSCDTCFNLSILEKDIININPESYGVVIVTRKGISIYSVYGDQKTTIYSQSVDLPKKHGRGGSSALRFARQRFQAKIRYIQMAATKINDIFYIDDIKQYEQRKQDEKDKENQKNNKQSVLIKFLLRYWFRTILKNEIISIDDIYQIINVYSFGGYVNVKGIILCGNDSFYCKVQESKILHSFIKDAMITTVRMVYKEHNNGLNEVIEKCSILNQNKETSEEHSDEKLIENVMNMLKDKNRENMVSIGLDKTLNAIKLHDVKYILVMCGFYKYVVKLTKHNDNGDKMIQEIKFVTDDIELKQISNDTLYSIDIMEFTKYFEELRKDNKIELKVVRFNRNSSISTQFAKGLHCIVGVLYHSVNTNCQNDVDDEWSSD